MTEHEYHRAWAASELRLRQIEEGFRAFHDLPKEEREHQEWFAQSLRRQAQELHELRIRLNMQRRNKETKP